MDTNSLIIRDSDLRLKAKVTGRRAANLIASVTGKWDTIHFQGDDKPTDCFILEQGGEFVNESGIYGSDSTIIYLFKGDLLLPMK